MTFGKNRVQYNDFYWSFLRYERFDTYYHEDGKFLAEFTGSYAKENLEEIEDLFDHTLNRRIIFVIYNKLSDFRQSNIGLVTGKEEYNVGGQTLINQNKVFLYFEGDFVSFKDQIRKAIAQIVLNEVISGSSFGSAVTSSTLINFPEWYTKGLLSYASKEWSIEIENRVRDGILSGKYEKINHLQHEDAVYAGHSFWYYIAETYGKSVIPDILLLSKYDKKVSSGFLNVLGLKLKEISYDWYGFYVSMFDDPNNEIIVPETEPVINKPAKEKVYTQFKKDPSGRYLAYSTNFDGKYKIFLIDKETGKKKKIFKQGNKLDQIVDYSYPLIEWHPTGQLVSFVIEEEGEVHLYYYSPETEELIVRNLIHYDKILEYSFSHKGDKIVFAAVKNGKSDIFIYTLSSSSSEQITNDIADDRTPEFIAKSTKIVFSSNRNTTSIKQEMQAEEIGLSFRNFIYDFPAKGDELVELEDESYENYMSPHGLKSNNFISVSDYSGIKNRYITEFDSTIGFIDTTIHYRYYSNHFANTVYNRNILEQDYDPVNEEVSEILFKNDRYFMYSYPLDKSVKIPLGKITLSSFRKKKKKELAEKDSLSQLEKTIIPIDAIKNNQIIIDQSDTIVLGSPQIDINNYIFEQEKINYYNEKYRHKNLVLVLDTLEEKKKKPRIYQTTFYADYFASQVDFGFLSQSYQQFTGGAVYFNPGTNALFKLGASDLFEDYKIIGGFRFSADFDANEFLFSIENLKYRTDRQFIFHRQSIKDVIELDDVYYLYKTNTNELFYILKHPFNQIFAVRGTASFRHDRRAILTLPDFRTLEKPTIHNYWLGLKGELIFDNTRSLGLNINDGTRYKVFIEAYKKIVEPYEDLYVTGVDFRHYQVIHRNFIFAARFAASSSFGKSRLLYYLGGVDNWQTFSGPPFTPLNEIPIDENTNYAYQTVATNMRGFYQNIRNGNNFALMNYELRWPVFKYFINHPISSSLIDNFQAVGFFDVGSAWSGWNPWSGENAYNTKIFDTGEKGPIIVILDSQRDPVVYGYGFGLRTKFLGYFMRFDWAWGIENQTILPRVFMFSLSLDF